MTDRLNPRLNAYREDLADLRDQISYLSVELTDAYIR